jgi:hypothetical protein
MLTKHDVSAITRIAYTDIRFVSYGKVIYKKADFLEVIKIIDIKLASMLPGRHIADFLFDEYPADMQSAFDDWMKAEAKNRQY